MKLKVVTAAIALVGALALPTIQADAQTNPPKKRTVVYNNRDNTVQISRDEDGRTRTRMIIQKRSYPRSRHGNFSGRARRQYRLCANSDSDAREV